MTCAAARRLRGMGLYRLSAAIQLSRSRTAKTMRARSSVGRRRYSSASRSTSVPSRKSRYGASVARRRSDAPFRSSASSHVWSAWREENRPFACSALRPATSALPPAGEHAWSHRVAPSPTAEVWRPTRRACGRGMALALRESAPSTCGRSREACRRRGRVARRDRASPERVAVQTGTSPLDRRICTVGRGVRESAPVELRAPTVRQATTHRQQPP